MTFLWNFLIRFNKFLNYEIKYSLFFLIINLIILSLLEFISIGSIPFLVGYLLDINSLDILISKDLSHFFQSLNKVNFIIVVVFGIFFIKSSYLAFVNFYELKTLKSLRIYVTNKLFKIYLNESYDFYLKNNHSVLARNLIAETDNCVGLIQSFIIVLREIFLLLIIFSLIFLFKPLLSFIILMILILFAVVFYVSTDNILKSIASKRISSMGAIFKLIPQMFSLIKEIKILNKENFFLKKFFKVKKEYENQIQKVDFIRRLPKIFFELIAVGLFLFLLIIFELDNKEKFIQTLPFFSLVVVSTIKLIPSFNAISGALTHIQSYYNSFNLIYRQVNDNEKIQITKIFDQKQTDKIISTNNLNFKFEESSKALSLKNINLNINKGDMIGIIGKSGSGKTTLINILLGLLKPTKGEVIYYANPDTFNIGHVPQDIVIFDDTLQNNIALGVESENIDQNKICEVIKFSGLQNFFEKNSSNLNMQIGDKGINISGGERQRIGIARALYFNPDIIILDEATSSLDVVTEKYIIDELLSIKRKVTAIFISHRMSALKNCDKIFVIENGEVKASGKLKDVQDLI